MRFLVDHTNVLLVDVTLVSVAGRWLAGEPVAHRETDCEENDTTDAPRLVALKRDYCAPVLPAPAGWLASHCLTKGGI